MEEGYEILKKEELTPTIKSYEIHAPSVAEKFRPGQFLILRINKGGERIPLTIVFADKEKGSVGIVVQEIGYTTKRLGAMNKGEKILDVLGPLGVASETEGYKKVVGVGGGVGAAPLYPIMKELKENGSKVTTIIGSRSKDLLVMEEDFKPISDEVIITTDDGSYGEKGFVTTPLKKLLEKGPLPDAVWAIGPLIMMKNVCAVTREFKVKTIVSLNPIMVDGTGMCGGCRATVGGETKFACVDGPEFDGHLVDFDELMSRNNRFCEEEKCKLLGS